MDYFAGLDVSLDTVNVCIVNDAGDVLLERKIEAEPAVIADLLRRFGQPFKRVGLEAGPTSSWLHSALRDAGYPAICLECRHVKAGLSAMRNKTDRNDARGIAHLLRAALSMSSSRASTEFGFASSIWPMRYAGSRRFRLEFDNRGYRIAPSPKKSIAQIAFQSRFASMRSLPNSIAQASASSCEA